MAWDDDVEEGLDQPAVYFSSSDLELVDDSYYKGPQLVGLRFAGVAIPSGAAISSATVRFVADESDSVATNLVVRGHDVGNAGRFGLSGGVSTLVATDAAVSWNTVEPWTRGGVYHSPDLAAVVQEIVDRADWRSGNALTLIVSGTGERTAESYDGDRASAPVLEVEYRR